MGYDNSKIYRLLCEDGCYYYGSTITSLKERLWHHKESSKTMKSKVYSHIQTIGWDKVTIELIEAIACNNRKELRIRENTYIQASRDDPKCLNTLRSYTSEEEKSAMEKERQKRNADHRKQVVQQYYESHKDEITKRHKQYYNENRDSFKQRCQEYNKTHKEEIREQRKKFYEENKERLCREKREKRAQNPELYKQKSREYREKNAERIREIKHRSREKKNNTDTPI